MSKKIKVAMDNDLSALLLSTRLHYCNAIKCKNFNHVNSDCNEKWIEIGESGKCAYFEESTEK